MVEPAKDRICDNIPEPLDRSHAGCVLPKRNMSSYLYANEKEPIAIIN